jgi:hypothetical protein
MRRLHSCLILPWPVSLSLIPESQAFKIFAVNLEGWSEMALCGDCTDSSVARHDVNAAQAIRTCLIDNSERPCAHWTCSQPFI